MDKETGIRIWPAMVAVALILAFMAWAGDVITMQGERTVYLADCQYGDWKGQRCSGQLVAGDRVRFRALKAHREVLFWTVGAKGPSHKFDDCAIDDGRNWVCKLGADAPVAITHQMVHGKPVADPADPRAFHAVPKWRWLLMRWGISLGNQAGD